MRDTKIRDHDIERFDALLNEAFAGTTENKTETPVNNKPIARLKGDIETPDIIVELVEDVTNPAARDECKKLINQAVAAALALNPRQYEDVKTTVNEGLVMDTYNAAMKALHVLDHVKETYSDSLLSEAEEFVNMADLAAFALNMRINQLLKTRRDNHWGIIGICSSTRRDIFRSLHPTEMLWCKTEGYQYESEYYRNEIEIAVSIRHQYAELRNENRYNREINGDNTKDLLQKTKASIVKLRESEPYDYMRIHDRQQLQEMQNRIQECLEDSDSSINAQHVLQDFAGLTEILMGINNRPELLSHDTELFDEALKMLEKGEEITVVIKSLQKTTGRNNILDTIIEDGICDPDELYGILNNILNRIGGNRYSDPFA